MFAAVAVLCFGWTDDLHATPLGRALLVVMAVFWIGRTVEQFVFLRLRHWSVHVLTALFVLGAALFAMPLF